MKKLCLVLASLFIFGFSNAQLTLTLSGVDVFCNGDCDGTGTMSATGGSPPYAYLWSDGQTNQTATGLCAGTYSATVTDNVAAQDLSSVTILEPPAIVLSTLPTNILCGGACTGTIDLTVTGGTPSYTFIWDNGETREDPSGICAGTSNVTVTDVNGCTATITATITEPPLLTLSLAAQHPTCATADGIIWATVSGGTPGYTYMWDGPNSQTTATATGLPQGLIQVTVTDVNGCVISGGRNLIDTTGIFFNIFAVDDTSGNCGGTLQVKDVIGTPPYTYSWSTGETDLIARDVCAGTNRCVTVTDATGCQGSNCGLPGGPPVTINPYRKTITGRVYFDMNSNCQFDSLDQPYSATYVRISPGHYALTDQFGNYSVSVNEGSYTITHSPNYSFTTRVCPSGGITVNMTSSDTLLSGNDFAYTASDSCSDLTISMYHVGYRKCIDSYYVFYYCNVGSAVKSNVYAKITMPDIVTVDVNGTHPWEYLSHLHPDSSNGYDYYFTIGTILPGECGSFRVMITVSCDAVMGETHCVEVELFPQDGCEVPDSTWDKSSLSVEGRCNSDSLACFTIFNTGEAGNGDMAGYSEYRIYVNNILVVTDSVMINGGDSVDICYGAYGKTIRLEADQRPGHPGRSKPRDNVELCGSPATSMGMITNSVDDDLDNFKDVYCSQVVSSWDPNDKRVQPSGFDDVNHFIDTAVRLQYYIRFQNTGNDTAFKVVVMDTLSDFLDITSVRPGASSHPYEFRIIGSNVLQFSFYNILLVDSNMNEPFSHGYANFTVEMDSATVIGDVITNRVGILFDYNEPVITNQVWSTVGIPDSILTSPAPTVYVDGVTMLVYPNPSSGLVHVLIDKKDNSVPLRIRVYGLDGRLEIDLKGLTGWPIDLDLSDLSDGIHIIEVSEGDVVLGRQRYILVR